MNEDMDCSTCEFEHQAADINDQGTRCGACLYTTRKGREYFPYWEKKKDLDDDYNGPPTINYS